MANTLFYVPYTRSLRPRWLLEELGVPYELHKMDMGETKKPDYLAVHPLGKVPAYSEDGNVILESAAILMHLADKHAEKGLAPALGTLERARYYQWFSFCISNIEPHLARLFSFRMTEGADPALAEAEIAATAKYFQILEKELQGKEFIVGDRFTAADVQVAATISWAKLMGATDGFETCVAYMKRMFQRPAARMARSD